MGSMPWLFDEQSRQPPADYGSPLFQFQNTHIEVPAHSRHGSEPARFGPSNHALQISQPVETKRTSLSLFKDMEGRPAVWSSEGLSTNSGAVLTRSLSDLLRTLVPTAKGKDSLHDNQSPSVLLGTSKGRHVDAVGMIILPAAYQQGHPTTDKLTTRQHPILHAPTQAALHNRAASLPSQSRPSHGSISRSLTMAPLPGPNQGRSSSREMKAHSTGGIDISIRARHTTRSLPSRLQDFVDNQPSSEDHSTYAASPSSIATTLGSAWHSPAAGLLPQRYQPPPATLSAQRRPKPGLLSLYPNLRSVVSTSPTAARDRLLGHTPDKSNTPLFQEGHHPGTSSRNIDAQALQVDHVGTSRLQPGSDELAVTEDYHQLGISRKPPTDSLTSSGQAARMKSAVWRVLS